MVLARILISLPLEGLRPARAFLFRGRNVPKPTTVTRLPLATLATIASNTALSASPAADLLRLLADRKSTRLNSSHSQISYAVFCLKKQNTLRVIVTDPAAREVFSKEVAVSLAGGEEYGQLLVEGMVIPIEETSGMFSVAATLLASS